MIKSNLFLLQYVKIQEETNFKVNMKAFSGNKKKSTFNKEEDKRLNQTEIEEDPEMKIETQKRAKGFLSAKGQESDEKSKILRNDIAVIKSLLEFEKAAKDEAFEQTKKLEEEFKSIKEITERKENQLNQRVANLELKVFCLLTIG